MEHPQKPIDLNACERIRTLLPAYAEGATTQAQNTQISAHLDDCRLCAEHLLLLRQLPEALDAALPAPDADLHRRIMREIKATPQCRPTSRRRTENLVASVLCLFLLCSALLLGTFNVLIQQDALDFAEDEIGDAPGGDGSYDEDKEAPDDPPTPPEGESDAPGIDEDGGNPPSESPAPEEPPSDAPSQEKEPFRPSLSLPRHTGITFVRLSENDWICRQYGYILMQQRNGEFVICDMNSDFAIGTHPRAAHYPTMVHITGKSTYTGILIPQRDNSLLLFLY